MESNADVTDHIRCCVTQSLASQKTEPWEKSIKVDAALYIVVEVL